MADLVAADLTYTAAEPANGEIIGRSKRRRVWVISTAAGEYPTGGLPLDNDKLGMPNSLESLTVLEGDVADPLLSYHWDKSANKIVVMEDDGTTGVPAEHANATFTTPDQLIVEVIGW
jgi:hypothetical protein